MLNDDREYKANLLCKHYVDWNHSRPIVFETCGRQYQYVTDLPPEKDEQRLTTLREAKRMLQNLMSEYNRRVIMTSTAVHNIKDYSLLGFDDQEVNKLIYFYWTY